MSYKIKCPYNAFDLRMASMSLTDEKIKEAVEGLDDALEEQFKTNEPTILDRVAAYHGISKKDLIDSPNYQILCDQYSTNLFSATRAFIARKDDLTDKQAWFIVMGLMAPDQLEVLLT